MKTRLTQFIPAVLALLIIGFDGFSRWCILGRSCYGMWVHHIYEYVTSPLYFFALYSLPLTVILILIPRRIFNSWLKLAAWTLPLLFIFVATQPVVASFLSTNRDDAARLAAEIFTVLSLVLILWKSFAARRTHKV